MYDTYVAAINGKNFYKSVRQVTGLWMLCNA